MATTRKEQVETLRQLRQQMAEMRAVAKLRKIEIPKERPDRISSAFRWFQRAYRHDLIGFVHDCIKFNEGDKPTEYQDWALSELPTCHRIAMYGPRGLGKSALLSWVIWWSLLTVDDVKVPITAGDWGQLEKYLWPEIHKWGERIRWSDKVHREPPIPGKEIMKFDMTLSATALTRTASPQDVATFEGAHAEDRVLICLDESKIIRPAIFDAIEGSFINSRNTENLALSFSTPSAPIGRFYDICSNREGKYSEWKVKHVTKEDQIKAGRLTPEFVEQRKKQWGEQSAIYQNQVEGIFAADAANTIIPWHYIEIAMNTWFTLKEQGVIDRMPTTALACDPAAGGGDKTVVAYKGTGNVVKYLREFDYRDTMMTANMLKEECGFDKTMPIYLDVIGIGTGIFDYLNREGYNVIPFNASSAAEGTDTTGQVKFLNKRAESWFQTRELMDPTKEYGVAIPSDDDLKGELAAPVWVEVQGGKRKTQSKEELREKLGRSTDHADPVIMALVGGAICHPYATKVEVFDVML